MHVYQLKWEYNDYEGSSQEFVLLMHEQKFSKSEYEDMVFEMVPAAIDYVLSSRSNQNYITYADMQDVIADYLCGFKGFVKLDSTAIYEVEYGIENLVGLGNNPVYRTDRLVQMVNEHLAKRKSE